MRKVKYRAWDKRAKEMIYQPGNFHNNVYGLHHLLDQLIVRRLSKGSGDMMDFILTQCTGQMDRNDTEIYEYDRLKDSRGRMYTVEQADWGWMLKPDIMEGSFANFNSGTLKHMEVVGTVYDEEGKG